MNPFDQHDYSASKVEDFRYHVYSRTDQARKRRDRYLSMFDDLFDLLD